MKIKQKGCISILIYFAFTLVLVIPTIRFFQRELNKDTQPFARQASEIDKTDEEIDKELLENGINTCNTTNYTAYNISSNSNYDIVVTLQSIFSNSNYEIKQIIEKYGVYKKGKKDLLDKENPFYVVFLSQKISYWVLIFLLIMTIANYFILFLFSLKKCPPKFLKRNMSVKPWSDFEKDTPAKLVLISSAAIVFLSIQMIQMLPELKKNYKESKCHMKSMVERSNHGMDNKDQYFYGYAHIMQKVTAIASEYKLNNAKLQDAAFKYVEFVKQDQEKTINLINTYSSNHQEDKIKSPSGEYAINKKIQPKVVNKLKIGTKLGTVHNLTTDYNESTLIMANLMINLTDTAQVLKDKQSEYAENLDSYATLLGKLTEQNVEMEDEMNNKLFNYLDMLMDDYVGILEVVLYLQAFLNCAIIYAVYQIYFLKHHKFIQVLNFIWIFQGAIMIPIAFLSTFGFSGFIFLQDSCLEFQTILDKPSLFQNNQLFGVDLRKTFSNCVNNETDHDTELNKIYKIQNFLQDVINFEELQIDTQKQQLNFDMAVLLKDLQNEDYEQDQIDSLKQKLEDLGFDYDYFWAIKYYQNQITNTLKDMRIASSLEDQSDTSLQSGANILRLLNSYTLVNAGEGEPNTNQQTACTGGLISNDNYILGPVDQIVCELNGLEKDFNFYVKDGSFPSVNQDKNNCFNILDIDNAQVIARYQTTNDIKVKRYDKNCQQDTYKDTFFDIDGITQIIIEYHKALYAHAFDINTLYQGLKTEFDVIQQTNEKYQRDLKNKYNLIEDETKKYFQTVIDSSKKIYLKTGCGFMRGMMISSYQLFCVQYTVGMYIFLFMVMWMHIALYVQVTMTFTAFYRIKNYVKPGESIRRQVLKQQKRQAKEQKRQEKKYRKDFAELKKKLATIKQDQIEYQEYSRSMDKLKYELKYSKINKSTLSKIVQDDDPETFLKIKKEKGSDDTSSLGSYDVNDEVTYKNKHAFSISSEENIDAKEIRSIKLNIGR